MIVDRRKDSYDELMMLSRDSRIDRNRKSRWTTGIVASAVVVSGIYVGGTNQHLGDLAQAKADAERNLETAKDDLEGVTAELAALKTERDFTRQNQDWFRDLAIALSAPDKVVSVVERIGPTPNTAPQSTLANVVWVVDGSRRFPMTAGDVLWIPEGEFWVKLEDAEGRPKPHKIAVHLDSQVTASTQPEEFVDFPEDATGPGYAGFYDRDIAVAAARGTTTCVRLTLHETPNRPGFVNTKYVDMEVLYHSPTTLDPCNSYLVEVTKP